MSRPVTLSHVAREAGVSPSTVSRILNGTAVVTADKRAAVEAAIERLRYRPNVIAQGLARGRSMGVGVLTQDIGSPFYAAVLEGIEDRLRGGPYHPVYASGHWHDVQERAALEALIASRADALIVLGGHLPDEPLLAAARRLPVVTVGRVVPGLEDRGLAIDNARAVGLGVRHLIELGHRRIAFLAGKRSHRDARDRQAGYRRALAEAGLEVPEELVVEGDFSEQSGLLALEALFARAALFTAVVAANDQMAYGARLALYRRGVRVPDDVSLVGFDDLPTSAYTTPPLTTVHQPTREMGAAAAALALTLLEGRAAAAPPMEARLVVRESTAPTRLAAVRATAASVFDSS